MSPHSSDIVVELSDTQSWVAITTDRLRGWARRAIEHLGHAKAAISVALVDDRSIRGINTTYLDHPWETDVITFALDEPGDEGLFGEIVISGETAVRVAQDIGTDPDEEVALYLVHGILHLAGLDDHSDADIVEMRRREVELMAVLGFQPRPNTGEIGS